MASEYSKERKNSGTTPAPEGSAGGHGAGGLVFVVQKHDASSLHYDFRLEAGGVLKSWAIPKGPSSDPSQKRLAIPTEDHAMEYMDFEGVIPEGEYGAGTVMIWDKGMYEVIAEKEGGNPLTPGESVRRGRIKFRLHGEKMKGDWSLVRMKGKSEWLLIKKDDRYAGSKDALIKSAPNSVVSGKSIEQIRQDAGA